jgi:saccharopine dehydrogenase-like NADP-dependent oxidoreductase
MLIILSSVLKQKHNVSIQIMNYLLTNLSSIGQLISSYLTANYPTVKINAIVRNASKVPAEVTANSNITIFEADSSDTAAVTKALKGTQVCICCYLGDNHLMIEGQKLLVDACIDVGVPRYIASDWSADYRTIALGEVPMKDPMKIIYAYLQEKEAAGKLRGVHILNGGFTEVLLQHAFANEEHTKVHYFGSGDLKIDCTTMPDAAAWTAEIAMDPSAAGVINGT